MKSFQEIMISKVIDLLSILKKDYCSKNYLQELLNPFAMSTFPETPVNHTFAKKSNSNKFSSNKSRLKIEKRKICIGGRQTPSSIMSKPTYKGTSARIKNRSLKTISDKTQKKIKKNN